MAKVVIDPGHGGTSEVGRSSPNNAKGPAGLLEKDVTLDLARRVRDALQRSSIDVLLTRDADANLGLKARADIARQANADAFISIHFNGCDSAAQGTETWHHSAASNDSRALAALVQAALCKATRLRDLGVNAGNYDVVRPEYHAATTAACLVEVSFMDTAAEEARLHTAAYKDQIAAALAGAIKGWLVADNRLAAPGPFIPDGVTGAESTTMPQDGYETRRLKQAQAQGPSGQVQAAQAGEERMLFPAANDSAGVSAMGIDFFEDIHRPETNHAGGVENLRGMLRGWRKEWLCPPGSDEVHPEAIIGRDESLEAAFLDVLAQRRHAVGIVRTLGVNYRGQQGHWSGTGFLVAPNLFLTNHHVLNTPETAEAAEIVFDYEVSARALVSGRKTHPAQGRSFRLRPDRLFLTSPAQGGLDYSFVWIEDVRFNDGALIRMERAAFAIQPEERAFVIHHPGGRPKRVSLDDTDIVTARPDGAVIHYTSDTEPGSSGAPVFDRSGRLIALHHASRPNSDGITTSDGSTPKFVNEGIKLAAIALDLETRRTREATAMIDLVLGEMYGSDTLTGFFGAAGRQVDAGQSGAERVADLYNATAQDLDIGFWNIAWFARHDTQKVDEVAAMVVDLGLDIWALTETTPAATEALVEAIGRKFGLEMRCAFSDPNAPALMQSTAVIWNPSTVDGEQLAWPADIDQLFQLRSNDLATASRPMSKSVSIFDRRPALFRFRGRHDAGSGIDFNLVALDLQERDEGTERRHMASQILARAVEQLIDRHGADRDWVLGGDFDAELTNSVFETLADARFMPLSAQDEADGALTYLRKPRSLIDHVFLSPNLSRLYGPRDFFILANEKSQIDYFKRFSGHRPVLLRLAARGAKAASAQRVEPDRALAKRLDAMLGSLRG